MRQLLLYNRVVTPRGQSGSCHPITRPKVQACSLPDQEEEVAHSRGGALDRGGQELHQPRQLQLPHGHHHRPQHVPRGQAEQDGE